MKTYNCKIQQTNAINLPRKIKEHNKEHNYTKVKWIINQNKTVKIQFLKNNPEQKREYTKEKDNIIFYRNIYNYAAIKIPVKIFKTLNCKKFDTIQLIKDKQHYQVTSTKKRWIKEASGLITKPKKS